MHGVSLAGCADQLDLPNLAVIEQLMREAQLVEHHYHGIARDAEDKKLIETKSKAPSRHEQELFLGSQKSHHESMVRKRGQQKIAPRAPRRARWLQL